MANRETEIQHAREMFTAAFATGKNLGSLSAKERNDIFWEVSGLCLEAAFAFAKRAEMVDNG